MSDYDAKDSETGGAPKVPGFGGHPLQPLTVASVAADYAEPVKGALAELGLEDCEQLVAATAVPGISKKLRNKLGLNKPDFKSLLQSARSALPASRAELVSQPAPRNLGLGVRTPSADIIAVAEVGAPHRVPEIPAAEVAALPGFVNLVPLMSSIRNQGARGTCVSFALTTLNEYVLSRYGLQRDLSEQHLYYETKLIDGAPNDCGTWQAKAVIALRDRGQCLESIWPYDPNLPCNNHGAPPPTARSNGLEYRLDAYPIPARNVAAYKAQLTKQLPVTVSIPVYDSWYTSNEVRRSGRITMRFGNEQPSGGHAVVAVGYQDSPGSPGGGYFILRNSWVPWAYDSPYGAGYGIIPYQYITNDAWEAYSAELADFELPEPSTTGAVVRIQVGSNVEITIEEGTPDTAPGRVSRGGLRPGRVS
jgi:Papain family cysteine protease